MNSVVYVPQEERYGCSLACMAMILNISYKEIRSMWPSAKEGSECGIAEYKRTSFLFKYGFIGHTEYATEAYTQRKRTSEEWIKPFAPVHIVSCITNKGPHAIVWLNDGRVYDPDIEGVHLISEYSDIQEITGYWKIPNSK